MINVHLPLAVAYVIKKVTAYIKIPIELVKE